MITLPVEDVLDTSEPSSGAEAIGRSREGRAITGFVFGSGPCRISLIAGCHADEPVGPAMLRHVAGWLAGRPADDPALTSATWVVVPHVNPDGEARNLAWSAVTRPAMDHRGAPDAGYDLALWLDHVVREAPGDDMEFGFPRDGADRGARPENRAVADFLSGHAPFHLHASFHSIAFATGPWFLVEPAWIEPADRLRGLRDALRARVRDMGYGLFDVDRGGEKGFRRIDQDSRRGPTRRPCARSSSLAATRRPRRSSARARWITSDRWAAIPSPWSQRCRSSSVLWSRETADVPTILASWPGRPAWPPAGLPKRCTPKPPAPASAPCRSATRCASNSLS